MNLLLVAGGVGGDLCGLWPCESTLFEVLPNLLTAGTGGVKVLLGVALDLGCAASSRRDLIAQLRESVHEFRLVDSGRKLLAVEVTLGLDGASGAVRAFRHIEDHGVRMELRRGIAIDRTGGVMLELGGNKLPSSFGGVVPADSSLSVSLQLGESGCDGFPVRLTHPVISTNKGGQRHRLWR